MADEFTRALLDTMYAPKDDRQPKSSTPNILSQIEDFLRRRQEKLPAYAGTGEALASIGSGILGSIPAGAAGVAELGRTRDLNKAVKRIEDIQEATTYVPRTAPGQRAVQAVGKGMEYLSKPAEMLGEFTLEKTGSPLAATAANILGDPLNIAMTPGGARAMAAGVKAVPKVAGKLAEEAFMPKVGLAGQRGAIDLGAPVPEFQPQGFGRLVSRADEALASLSRQKGTGEEFLRELQKMPGVKPAELEERGLDTALLKLGKTTKADVLKVLEENPPVKLEEVVLKEPGGPFLRMPGGAEYGDPSGTKYGQYTLPGGENYRELLLKLPSTAPEKKQYYISELEKAFEQGEIDKDAYEYYRQDPGAYFQSGFEPPNKDYISSHWEEPNVLAHARISDRTGPNGEKILHVEELQSDWHQTGRKSGYVPKDIDNKIEVANHEYQMKKLLRNDKLALADRYPEGHPTRVQLLNEANEYTPKIMGFQSELDDLKRIKKEGVPDAPFKKNWHELMMKRLVNYAAENGYDRIAITPGAEQASRYDLSKQVNNISWQKNSNGTYSIEADTGRGEPIIRKNLSESDLANTIGKEVAQKIVDGVGKFEDDKSPIPRGQLANVDLKVGGEGMKGFYDKILPDYLNSLGKPYGVKVGETDLITAPEKKGINLMNPDEPEIYPAQTKRVHSFDITPQMREAIKTKGLPLYKKGGSVRKAEGGEVIIPDMTDGGKVIDGGYFKKGGKVHISKNPDTMRLALMAGGGLAKGAAKRAAEAAAKRAEREIPPPLTRAEPKTKAEIEKIAERMAPQILGEYVRKSPESAVTVAGKTKKQFEREKNLPVELSGQAKESPTVDIESLKGKALMGILGDPSITGRELKAVGETRLESPAPQHGGPMYGMGREDEAFWASGKGAAKKVQNLADEISKQYSTDVLGKYIMMGPEGLNYAQHFADANLQAIDLSRMTKKQVEQFDELMRRGSPSSGPRPTFPGIEDKEGAYLHMAFDPELRKHFNSLMQMNTVTERLNLPNGQDIRYAITEPLLRDLERGVTGKSIGEMRPGAELKLSEHPTYEMDIPGKFLGSSKYPIPYELMFPDTVKSIRENPRQAPHEFGSLGMVGPRQIVDQQMIDEIKAYEERLKKLTGKKKGGAVKKKGGKVSFSNDPAAMRQELQKKRK